MADAPADGAAPATDAPDQPGDIDQALFTTLARHKVLPARLAKKLVPMAGFRNVLVHEYLEIDRRRVYRALKQELRDFESFVRAITKLL